MENVNNGQRDQAELDIRVDENDAIFSDNNNENPRRAPRDHSRERDGDSVYGRDSCREGDDRREGTLDCSREREGNAQKRPRSSHLKEGEIVEDEEPVKKKSLLDFELRLCRKLQGKIPNINGRCRPIW